MGYIVTLNNQTEIINTEIPNEYYAASEAKVIKTAGATGTFTFKIPAVNGSYDTFTPKKDWIRIYKASVANPTEYKLKFTGRVTKESKDFYNNQTVTCAGAMDVLNDSVLRPYTYESMTVKELFEALIANHNSQVGADSEAALQSEMLIYPADYATTNVYREFQNYESTYSRMADLIDTYGGYLDVEERNVNGVLKKFLSVYPMDYDAENAQTIDFGQNLIDITRTVDRSEIYTVIIPIGAEIEDSSGTTRDKLTIVADARSGGKDYIEADSEYIEKYGRIYHVETWNDVTVAANLYTKGYNKLQEVLAGTILIDATALNLANAGKNIDDFELYKKAAVNSEPHGLTSALLTVKQASFDLLNTNEDRLVLGQEISSYTKSNQAKQNSMTKIINNVINNYASGEAVTLVKDALSDVQQTVITNEAEINNLGDRIETVVNQQTDTDGRVTQLESQTSQTAEQYNIWFGQDGKISSWFEFSDDSFKIRKNGTSVYSEQTSNSYAFKDTSGHTLMTLNERGLSADIVNIDAQAKFTYSDADMWAIRHGALISGGVNLDVVWIGG